MPQENNPVGLADPGSPTERNTPTPEPELELDPEPLQDSQKSNQSFSDLLNYEMCASQKSEHGIAIETAPTSIPALAPAPVFTTSEDTTSKKSRAEQLRTRLKFGLYKVKTNQVNKRDADIISTFEACSSFTSDALHASRSTAMTSSGESLGSYRVPDITVSAPRWDQGPTFVKANLDPFRPIGKLGAAPVQFLPPQDSANVSSRMLHAYELSSSPPDIQLPNSLSPGQLMSPVRSTPQYTHRLGELDTADLESEPHQRLQRLKELSYARGELATSAGQGNAAEGLLELMHARR